ncbi:hypothetical protein OC834_004071 [Tilletia horrida]|uniref:SLC41A/MgtE integral membrane domain-containing protein n=1 Tax=Tilletia horrida TaxID=155126 RepID=A0AAN6JNN6_9BASI|nr:hypothetical protein OC834_004071 [Tilletia horrida]KAK0538496.1 hypothetical protein OC842_001276 [Tilletia horrida]
MKPSSSSNTVGSNHISSPARGRDPALVARTPPHSPRTSSGGRLSSDVAVSPSRAAMIAAARSHPRASLGHVDPQTLPDIDADEAADGPLMSSFTIGHAALSLDGARPNSPSRRKPSVGAGTAVAVASPLSRPLVADGDEEEGGRKAGDKTTHARARELRRTIDQLSEDEDDEDDADEEDDLVERLAGDDEEEDPLSRSVRSHPGSFTEPSTSNLQDGRFLDRSETAGKSVRARDRSLASQIWAIAREALPSLTFSVVSLILTGQLLVHLARWPVFLKVDKLFILIPILLNLKGNLEMNLSLRMSTSANIGELDIRRTRQTLIAGNLALLQVQALIVSAFAGTLAFVLGVITPSSEQANGAAAAARRTTKAPGTSVGADAAQLMVSALASRLFRRGGAGAASASALAGAGNALQPRRIIHHHPKPTDPALRLRNGYFEFVLVLATGMLSASFSSAILGSFMCALVVITRKLGANPDNIASPLAASLGDLLTLTILGLAASSLVAFEGTVLATIILGALMAACLSFFIVSYRNAYVRELLTSGWVPLLVAMFISSGAGLVLDAFVQKYQGFALLVPVSTGLPGAAAAIFASRISTALHSGVISLGSTTLTPTSSFNSRSSIKPPSRPSRLSRYIPRRLRRSWSNLISSLPTRPVEGWLVPTTLFVIVMVIDVAFLGLVKGMGEIHFGWTFALCYALSKAIAVVIALALSHGFCHYLWAKDYDPDIYCLPFVSSIVDVVGQALLVMAFSLAEALGEQVTANPGAGAGHGGM